MAGASGLPLAGVEAIVEGLSSFQGDVRQMNSALDSIRPRSTMLQNAFSSAWEMVKNFGREILNVAEYALGHILADAIEFAVQKIGELVSATVEAGSEFQTLELRLNGLNVDALTKSGMEFNEATQESIKLTKEQLEWLQKLAAQTPYDNTDISNVYTLSRTYGFADDAAKELTESVVDFAAGMGLSKEVLERVIMNLGQMVQRGKITSTEMRDLARGAFLPLDDILQRIADHMNETGTALADNSEDIQKSKDKLVKYTNQMEVLLQKQSEFTDKTKESTKLALTNQIEELQKKIDDTTSSLSGLQSTTGKVEVADIMKAISEPGGGLPAQLFIDAFNEMVKGEPRFQGAAERMAKTFKAASDNAMDMVKSIGGLNIVKPILDVIGEKISKFVDTFTGDPGRWNRLVKAATKLGEALSSVVEGVLGLIPSADSLADKVVKTIESIATWITDHRNDIIGFFVKIGTTIKEEIIPWIQDKFIPALLAFGKWVEDNKSTILKFFETVGTIVGDFFKTITSQPGKPEGEGGVLESITKFMTFVIENKDAISKWVDILWSVFIVWQVLATIWNIALTIAIGLGAAFLALSAVFAGLSAVIGLLAPIFVSFFTFIGAVAIPFILGLLGPLAIIAVLIAALVISWKVLTMMFDFGLKAFKMNIEELKNGIKRLVENFQEMVAKVKEAFANGDWIGVGKAIIEGMINGLSIWVDTLVTMARNAATLAAQEVRNVFGGGSAGAAAVSVNSGAGGRRGNNYSTQNQYNLNINSSANTEPVIQDFLLLQSMNTP